MTVAGKSALGPLQAAPTLSSGAQLVCVPCSVLLNVYCSALDSRRLSMISFVVTDVLTPEISKGDFDDFSGRIENTLPSLRLTRTLPSFWADSNTDENF
jgi:hypothetical protein